MKKNQYILFLILPILLSACNCIVGEGDTVSEQREVSGFERISLSIDAKVILKQEEDFSLRVDAQSNIIEILETRVQGDVLNIGYGFNCVMDASDITVYLSMPELKGVDLSGSGEVICMQGFDVSDLDLSISGSGEILMELNAGEIRSRVSGSGEIDIAGKAKKLDISISGSGSVYAYNLRTPDVNVNIIGSGDARVYPTESLYAGISGSGSVYYKGEPRVDSDVTGSGQVKKRN
jgi:hypothetical protein